MTYSVRFHEGKATFHSDYIKTPRYLYELREGSEWFGRLGEFSGKIGLLKFVLLGRWKMKAAQIEKIEMTTGNTAVSFTPDKRVWALFPGYPPFGLRVQASGAVESLGSDTLNGTFRYGVSAHPRIDYTTGDTFYHNLDPSSMSLYVGHIANGEFRQQTALKASPPVGQGFNHDLIMTQDYVVAIDGAMRFDIRSVLNGSSMWNFDPNQSLRFGVYPRAVANLSSDNFVWIEAPFAAEIVHHVFAYNEGHKIVLWTSMCSHDPERTAGVLGGMGIISMAKLTIDVSAKTVTREALPGDEFIEEFGRFREDRSAGRARYAYTALSLPQEGWQDFNFSGIAKWDLFESKRVGVIHFSGGVVGGEPIFVPRGEEEDDGYISMFLWHSATRTSTFALFNATTFASAPELELDVPTRVPLGFHGRWLTESELSAHLSTA
jgi:carotenoid cleavage dioxygenase-like enzyme